MGNIILRVLGALEVLVDDMPTHPDFRSDKIRALLVYLALESGRQHRRRSLAGLLWPEFTDRASLRNLRKALFYLRQALDQLSPGASEVLLVIDRQSVQLHLGHLWVDALRFEELLSAVEEHSHRHLHLCPECLDRLGEAVALYRGELLAGVSLRDAAAFEEWLLFYRERLQQQAIAALDQLTAAYLERGDREQALNYASRQVGLDRFRENAHRQMMQLLILSGEYSRALAQYESLRRLLEEELGVEPEAATTTLYRQIQAAQRGEDYPGISQESAALHGFPAQFTPFIGREAELLQIEEKFLDPDCRLLTLIGPGGIGKTRLAIRAGEQLASKALFPDGIYFISLAEVTGGDALLSALARGLGVSLSDRPSSHERVLDFLRERQCLLILDNFEQLLGSASVLVEMLAAAPGLRLMVTSYFSLELSAEQRLVVSGLPYPAKNEARPDLAPYSSVRLFSESARQADAGFSLIPENEAAVHQICRLVQGIPLALELAATWVGVMDCAEIAGEIERSLDFLSLSPQDKPGRHQSMAAVLAYSWQLLEPSEQVVLVQLAVFKGPFSLEAAMTITVATPLVLARLLGKSLVQRRKDGRYELHGMLRQFIHQHTGDPDRQTAEEHSEYYLNLVAARQAAFYGPQPRQASEPVQTELANIRQAWQWAIQQGSWPALTRSLEGLGRFYHVASIPQEGEAMMALATARLENDQVGLPAGESISRFFIWRAFFLHKLGRHAQAIQVVQQALELAGQDEAGRVEAHSLLGELLPAVGKFDQARDHLERAVQVYRSTNDLDRLARALHRMALAYFRGGDHERALDYSQQAMPLLRVLEHRRGLAQLYNVIAGIYYEQHDLEQALAFIQQAQELYESIDDKLDAAIVAANLASLYSRLGQFDQALASNQRAVDISRELGDRPGLARDLSNRGHLLATMGEFDRSLDNYYRALKIEQALGDASRVAYFQSGIATVYQMKGDDETALVYYDLALPVLLAQATSYYHVVGPMLGKAELLFQKGDRAQAQALHDQAFAIATEVNLAEYILQSRMLGAKLAFAAGDPESARQQLLDLLAETVGEEEQAALHYELWQITQDGASAEAALLACQKTYDKVPSFVNKMRLEELQRVVMPE
jgi:predicted ATPase/DNA-binding SARP family transcriptional activator